MTHEELEAIRVHLARLDKLESIPAGTAQSLLAYIDELHGVVHDLRQEPGWELGRQEERRDVLALLQERLDTLRDLGGTADNLYKLGCAMTSIAARGPVAPHLAPDDLRRENEALRAALREVLRYFDPTRVLPFHGQRYGDMIAQAHRLLGGDV